MTAARKVIFILGTGHCGSTLVDLILGSHSHAFSLGEMRYAPRQLYGSINQHRELCGICDSECPFWSRPEIKTVLRSCFKNGANPTGLLFNEISPWVTNLYRHLFDWTGAGVLIDSSKSLHWVRKQHWPRYHWNDIDPFLLFLVRDGRAVVNSLLRKYPEKGTERITRYWKRCISRMQHFYDRYPTDRKLCVRYEEFALSPRRIIELICKRTALQFEEQMLRYWQHDHHAINANLGTKSLIFKYREARNKAQARYWKEKNAGRWRYDEEYYENIGLNISLDLRWKREMQQDQLETFQKIAGKTNERYIWVPSDTAGV